MQIQIRKKNTNGSGIKKRKAFFDATFHVARSMLPGNKGFTFVELIVVIAIFGILSSVILFNFKNFTSAVTLQNLAHDVALQINQAQKVAISGQTVTLFSSTPAGFHPRYGAYFESGAGVHLTTPAKEFIYFADFPSSYNEVYDVGNDCGAPSNTTECLDKITVETGDSISKLCVNVKAVVGKVCSNTGTVPDLNITFTRPFPDAVIKINPTDSDTQYTDAEIVVTSSTGDAKTVVVTKLGQIYVEDGDTTL